MYLTHSRYKAQHTQVDKYEVSCDLKQTSLYTRRFSAADFLLSISELKRVWLSVINEVKNAVLRLTFANDAIND